MGHRNTHFDTSAHLRPLTRGGGGVLVFRLAAVKVLIREAYSRDKRGGAL